jgi:hypothetical protein
VDSAQLSHALAIQIGSSGALAIAWEHPMAFASSAFMGFTVNVLAYVTIKLASSLTLKAR